METKRVILVVDDEESLRQALCTILQDEGYAVLAADSGEKALELLAQAQVDLVLTDMRMEGMDGIELLKRIREQYGDLGVIMLTGYGEIETYIKAMNFGAIEYVSKPFRANELKFIVNKILNDKE